MKNSTLSFKLSNPVLSDLLNTLLYGVLSGFFSLIHLEVEYYENAITDLREIPLIIALYYLRNPLWIVLMCLINPLLFLFNDGPYYSTVIMHVFPLLILWYFYQKLNERALESKPLGVLWLLAILAYFFLLLVPSLILTYQVADLHNSIGFWDSYRYLISSLRFEIPATAFTCALYLVQLNTSRSLKIMNTNLESIVADRTREIQQANEELSALNQELVAVNEEIKLLNANLEINVEARTQKIQRQYEQLSRYAHMNSHEVRGPLARILGLLALLQKEEDLTLMKDLVQRLMDSGNELDAIIRKMNILLNDEIQ